LKRVWGSPAYPAALQPNELIGAELDVAVELLAKLALWLD